MLSIERQLRKLYEDIIAKEKIEIHLKNIDRLILQEEEALKIAELQTQKEGDDITRLEGKSLYVIFKIILGTKEQELEKERQEYLQAYLKKNAIIDCLKSLKQEKEILLQSYSGKFNAKKQFDKLLTKKKKEIEVEQPELAKMIIHFEGNIANHKSRITELHQAIREGKKTSKILESILVSLDQIEKWGNSYGRISPGLRTKVKGKVQRKIHQANKNLQNFEKELFDLSDHYNHNYSRQINEIKDFVDQFLDSLITDWIVKKEIVHSANIVSNLIDKVTRIVGMLENEVKKTKTYIADEKKVQRKLIATHRPK